MERQHIRAYYEAALTALRYLEHRAPSGRRFDQDADLLWASFRGHLAEVDRIDLLVRDADAQWPGSMGARRVFDRHGVALDDAFGKGWERLDTVAGADLFRETVATPPPVNLGAALSRIAAAWDLTLAPFLPARCGLAIDAPRAPEFVPICDSSPLPRRFCGKLRSKRCGVVGIESDLISAKSLPFWERSHEISPHHFDRRVRTLVLAGPSAVAALAQLFEDRNDLGWADQVAVVATGPGPRQLAAFCEAALNITNAMPTLLAAGEQGR